MGYAFAGFLVGFLNASLGIGGGVLLVPILAYVLHMEFKKAIGTSLATIVPTSLVAVITHYLIKSSNLAVIPVITILFGSLIGAWIGSKLVVKLSSALLKFLFSMLLIFAGLKLIGVFSFYSAAPILKINLCLSLVGLFAGISSVLLGIGGGVIIVPSLNIFFGFSMHQAVTTSLAVIFPTTLMGALLHKRLQNIEGRIIKYILPSAAIGALAGAFFSNTLPSSTLRKIFGSFLILISMRILLESIRSRLLNL